MIPTLIGFVFAALMVVGGMRFGMWLKQRKNRR